MSDTEFIIKIVELIIFLLVGGGGVFALVKTILTINKKSSVYEVRCKLASEMLKRKVVEMKTPEQTQLFIDILDGVIDETPHNKQKVADKVIKLSEKKIK